MNTTLKKINHMVLADLVADKAKLEYDLEQIINGEAQADEKVTKIRYALKAIANNNQELLVWKTYIPEDSDETNKS